MLKNKNKKQLYVTNYKNSSIVYYNEYSVSIMGYKVESTIHLNVIYDFNTRWE